MAVSKPDAATKGLTCSACGCQHFSTTHTEPLRDGRIRRRKECRHCGRKLVTYEAAARSDSHPDCYR